MKQPNINEISDTIKAAKLEFEYLINNPEIMPDYLVISNNIIPFQDVIVYIQKQTDLYGDFDVHNLIISNEKDKRRVVYNGKNVGLFFTLLLEHYRNPKFNTSIKCSAKQEYKSKLKLFKK